MEQPELSPPSGAAIVGTYTIVEETVSGKPLAQSSLEKSSIEVRPGGTAQFTDFPLFDHRRGIQGIPRKTTQAGRWLISPAPTGYCVLLDLETENRTKALIVEGGDFIIYYAPSSDGYFTKWRKTN